MNRQEIVATVQAALNQVLERKVTHLPEETRLSEDMHLDSTSILELMLALEDTAGISVDPETLDMDDFTSVKTLANYLQAQHTKSKAAG
jgi:acyl carrier protein